MFVRSFLVALVAAVPSFVFASSSTDSTASSITTIVCPDGTSPGITVQNGENWGKCTGATISLHDIISYGPSAPSSYCYAKCAAWANCVAFQYDKVYGYCRLKSAQTMAKAANAAISDAYFRIPEVPSSSTTASSTTTSSSSSSSVSSAVSSLSPPSSSSSSSSAVSSVTNPSSQTTTTSTTINPSTTSSEPTTTSSTSQFATATSIISTTSSAISSATSTATPSTTTTLSTSSALLTIPFVASTTSSAAMSNAVTTSPSPTTSISESSSRATTSSSTTTVSPNSASITTSTTMSTSTRISTTTSAVSSTGICAGGVAPRSTQTASNGDVYGVCPGNDFYGGDLSAPYAPTSAHSLSDCIEACTKAPKCIAAAYIPSSGVCWVKSSRGSANYNGEVDAIYKISSGSKKKKTKKVKCSKVTAGSICPNKHIYRRKHKSICDLSQDEAKAACANVNVAATSRY